MRLAPAAAIAVAGAIFLAPPAFAAPPANDIFDDREALVGSLPIEVGRSNLEATKEAGEAVGPLAAGHSVWFEWEASATGFVTVGVCDSDFDAVVGVFTGTAVNSLTWAPGDDGPHCAFGPQEYTFKAVIGTKYAIAVDGNAFSPPGGPQADTEGSFDLRIEAAPTPVNDNFAAATTLFTDFQEEFEGNAFYFDSAFGYNWNASVEPDEPAHVGGPYEASVWYSWTPPVSGDARIAVCCGPDLGQTIYTGDNLKALQALFGGVGPFASASFVATQGATYRIAVYSLVSESSGEAQPASFSLQASVRSPVTGQPAAKPAETPGPADTAAPDTTIVKRLLRSRERRATFRLRSSEQRSTFRCKLDKRPFRPCTSPKTYRRLVAGWHTFRAVAVDASGNADPWPAVARFRIAGRARAR